MTDKELLALCADAFDAMKLLRSGRISNAASANIPYAGNRSHVLAKVMAERVRNHIEADKMLSGE